jgi:hypothetical protein
MKKNSICLEYKISIVTELEQENEDIPPYDRAKLEERALKEFLVETLKEGSLLLGDVLSQFILVKVKE